MNACLPACLQKQMNIPPARVWTQTAILFYNVNKNEIGWKQMTLLDHAEWNTKSKHSQANQIETFIPFPVIANVQLISAELIITTSNRDKENIRNNSLSN